MIRPCWVSGWARQLGVVWLVEASKDLHALQHPPICTIAPPFHQLVVVVVIFVVDNVEWPSWEPPWYTRPGLFSSSLRIRNWTYRTSCKGRPGPHAVAVQALRTSSANQLHYALPCEKLRGILCSCPLNTDRILALKNTLKGARLIGGFG